MDSHSYEKIKQLYKEQTYLSAYSMHTNIRVKEDPYNAVGGLWEEIGELQFDFLVKKGLQPEHKMLDLGCGTLRGGRFFIHYLKPQNYSGIDISEEAIKFASKLIQQESLVGKKPLLFLNKKKKLDFKEFSKKTFDYVLAQSVFTHLKPEHIEECFLNIGSVTNEDSKFYFTYQKGKKFKKTGLKDFCYPFSFFESLAEKYKFKLKNCSKEYQHPRNQEMVEMKKGQE